MSYIYIKSGQKVGKIIQRKNLALTRRYYVLHCRRHSLSTLATASSARVPRLLIYEAQYRPPNLITSQLMKKTWCFCPYEGWHWSIISSDHRHEAIPWADVEVAYDAMFSSPKQSLSEDFTTSPYIYACTYQCRTQLSTATDAWCCMEMASVTRTFWKRQQWKQLFKLCVSWSDIWFYLILLYQQHDL